VSFVRSGFLTQIKLDGTIDVLRYELPERENKMTLTYIDDTTDLKVLLAPYGVDELETHYIAYNSELQNGKIVYYDALDKSFKGGQCFATPYTKKKAENIIKRLAKKDPTTNYHIVAI